ncbi:MAG: T9SS type A sorting domain-containing protein, partial [Bacteroidota bacterium]
KTKLLLTLLLISIVSFLSYGQSYIKIDATFFSESLQEEKRMDIYLPGDYYVNLEQQYATIYYLHGAGGDENSGNQSAMHYYMQHAQDSTINSPPAIFVCMDGSCEPYSGSCYMNSELYGPYEDYTIDDVIGFVESNFRAISDKNFRFVTGWSMGGFGSARLSCLYPEYFRASIPCIGFLSFSDTLNSHWRRLCYEEQGSYSLSYTGYYTKLYVTTCGGLSPNMDLPPLYIEVPFDTNGNWVDSVLTKHRESAASSMVKNLPDEDELAWFLIAGRYDEMASFPTYQDFMDSLDYYGIKYDTSYFDGGHEFDLESWWKAIHWIDSIMELSFSTLGIPVYEVKDDQMILYPNPASDQITIQNQFNEVILEVKIYSQDGKMVIHRRESDQVLDVSYLPQGIYILEARTEAGIVRSKFIKR